MEWLPQVSICEGFDRLGATGLKLLKKEFLNIRGSVAFTLRKTNVFYFMSQEDSVFCHVENKFNDLFIVALRQSSLSNRY